MTVLMTFFLPSYPFELIHLTVISLFWIFQKFRCLIVYVVYHILLSPIVSILESKPPHSLFHVTTYLLVPQKIILQGLPKRVPSFHDRRYTHHAEHAIKAAVR
jgi:hypothetical protein